MVTVLLALCPALWAHVGIQPWGSREGHPPQRDGVHPQDWVCCALSSLSLFLHPLCGDKARKNFFPEQGPPPPAREHWDLATVAVTSPTEKERECNLKIGYGLQTFMQTAKNVGYAWYPAPHLHTICTMDSCHFPGWNKTPQVQQAPQLSRAEIFSRVLQSGFPSDGNISHPKPPAPLFQMLSMFSAPATHSWR